MREVPIVVMAETVTGVEVVTGITVEIIQGASRIARMAGHFIPLSQERISFRVEFYLDPVSLEPISPENLWLHGVGWNYRLPLDDLRAALKEESDG